MWKEHRDHFKMSSQQGYTCNWNFLKLQSYLGQGSFGLVFAADVDPNSNLAVHKIDVAIKVLFEDPANSREFHIMQHKKHSNIVTSICSDKGSFTAVDMGKLKGILWESGVSSQLLEDYINEAQRRGSVTGWFLIMERCGLTMRSWLDEIENGSIQRDNLFGFLVSKQIIDGVKYLHTNDIIHRDLKPANIYFSVGDSLPVKIGDFGLSRTHNKTTRSVTPNVGNKLYRAPEVYSDRYYNKAVDIFAVGLMILEVFQPFTSFKERDEEFSKLKHRRSDASIQPNSMFKNLRNVVFDFTDIDPTKRLSAFEELKLCYLLPQRNWKSLQEVVYFFNAIKLVEWMPENFMAVLIDSITYRNGTDGSQRMSLRRHMWEHEILYHYDMAHHSFDESWTMAHVTQAVKKLEEKIDSKSALESIQKMKQSKKNLPSVPVNSPATDEIHDLWKTFLGHVPIVLRHSDFLRVTQLHSCPGHHTVTTVFQSCMPYILQSIKMGNPEILSPAFLKKILVYDKESYSSESTNISSDLKPRYRFSRLDLIVGILSTVEGILGLEMCKKLARFHLALPVIMPKVVIQENKKYVITIPWMKGIIVKRGTTSGNIIENRLFVDPYKLVLAVRMGSSKVGKSSLLNSLFKTVPYTFTCRYEPGGKYGLLTALESCVEYTWLTRENIDVDLWNSTFEGIIDQDETREVFLLANLHGSTDNNRDIIKQLQPITSAYIVFKFQKKHASLRICEEMEDIFAENNSAVKSWNAITTNTCDSTTKETIAGVLKSAFCGTRRIQPNKYAHMPLLDSFVQTSEVQTRESWELDRFLSVRTCAELKRELRLQRQNPIDTKEAAKALTDGSPVLRTLIQRLGNILALPFEEQQVAISHIEQEMSLRSGNESKQIRQELCNIKDQKIKIAKKINAEQLIYSSEYKTICNNVQEHYKKLEGANLGFEHLIREMGKVYEVVIAASNNTLKLEMDEMIRSTAKLLINGQAIELVDGDAGVVSGPWVTAVLKEVDRIEPKLRIYAISIIGMQSSGKSTLLNALFGCKFPVSAGRCTRGLFMRLLFLDEDLIQKLNIDAILVIDTEGMCAPEKMMDKNADQRDRELATFAMLLSNLTIVNLMGETMKEMTDILQIVIVTLARIEKVVIPPDIWLVQHCSEVDNSRVETSTRDFAAAIKEAIGVTHTKYSDLGVVNSSCLKKLQYRVDHEQFLSYFHPYKSGATANASPSKEYYQDTRTLFKKVFSVIQESKRMTTFRLWQDLFLPYWINLRKEDFSLRFKNIQDVYEFIDRGEKIAKVNNKIVEAIGFHRKQLKHKIRRDILMASVERKDLYQLATDLEKQISETIGNTIESCPSLRASPVRKNQLNCQCKQAFSEIVEIHKFVNGKPVEKEVMQTIKSHKDKVRANVVEFLNDHLHDQKHQYEVHMEIDECIYYAVRAFETTEKRKSRIDMQMKKEISASIEKKVRSNLNIFANEANFEDKKKILFAEIAKEYANMPLTKPEKEFRLREHYSNTNLGCVVAFSKGQSFSRRAPLYKQLKENQQNELELQICERVKRLIGGDEYRHGSIGSLRQEIDKLLEVKEKEWRGFEINFRWETHFYAIQLFIDKFDVELEKRFFKTRNQFICYIIPKKIEAELDSRTRHEVAGKILAECILFAILQKAKKEIERDNKHSVLQQHWIQTVEGVRLKFAEYLIEMVEDNIVDQFPRILNSFLEHPKKSITDWFVDEVDKTTLVEQQIDAGKIYNSQFQELYNSLSSRDSNNNPISITDRAKHIRDVSIDYLAEIDGMFNPCDEDFVDEESSREFFNSFFETINSNSQQGFSELVYKRCSDSKAVMDKLGCTEFCQWCGAICWGHAAHDKNEDLTRKHHACHQPMGLRCISDSNDRLLATTCDQISEEFTGIRNRGIDVGLTWAQIKHRVDENWIFIKDTVEDYRNLMLVVFAKYNERLADKFNASPSAEDTLQNLQSAFVNKFEEIKTSIAARLAYTRSASFMMEEEIENPFEENTDL